MSPTPDYAALVSRLPTLRNLVDACGEVALTAEEAAQISSLGFPAEVGRWKVPPIPFELVRDNPLLEHLSIGWDSARIEATSNSPNSKSQSCEGTQIIEGNCGSVLADTKPEEILQPINVHKQHADRPATAANRTRPARARTIRQELELAVPSEHTAEGGDGTVPKRHRAGYQLPCTPQEQDRMADEAASRIERTLNKAYWEGKRMKVRDLQQRHWRFPAFVVHQAMRLLERSGRIL